MRFMAETKVEKARLLRLAQEDRLRVLGQKARRNPKSLTLQELEEICELVAVLTPKEVH